MSSRIVTIVAAALLALAGLAAPALAVDDDEDGGFAPPLPAIDDPSISSNSEISMEFRPEVAEPPHFFQLMSVPILAGALILFVISGGLYLLWQPRFAKEDEQSGRR